MTELLSSAPEPSADSRLGRLITCGVEQLHPHPSLVRLHIVPPAHELSRAIGQRKQFIEEPLTITQDSYILAGHAAWDIARRRGETTLPCLQLDMTEEEALLWLLQKHQSSPTINDFSRILLALELEPWFKERARTNRQLGGRKKGSSNLTEADKMDVRREIADAAGVSVGNVSKVKRLLKEGAPELLQAIREGEVSIHRATVFLASGEQLAQLRLYQNMRGVSRKIDLLLQAHRVPKPAGDRPLDVQRIVTALAAMNDERTNSIVVAQIQLPGEVLLLSAGLLQRLESQGKLEL
jgi:hypothetical protein